MDVLDFKNNYLSQIFENISKEQKQVFLLGDFNINFLNYNDHQPTNDFLDSLASNSFISYILHPTRITSHSKTLIDNIFSNFISSEIISGNITATISDHLPQFSFVPNIMSILIPKNLTIMKEIGQNLNKKTLYLTILIKIGLIFNLSMDSFLNNINSILDVHAPLKKLTNIKFKAKPWITPALQKLIFIKNNLLKEFITAKDPQVKENVP